MKFRYIYSVVLLLILSCQKEEIQGGESATVDFSVRVPGVKVETRSTLIDYDADTFDYPFGVYGYCVPYKVLDNSTLDHQNAVGEWNSKRFYTGPDVFDGFMSVNYIGGKCTYTYQGAENSKSWVTEGSSASRYTYTFFSYYPHIASSPVWSSSVQNLKSFNTPTFTFTMPISNQNGVVNDSAIPDAMVAETYDHLRSDGAVPLKFRHILTAVNVEIVNYDNRDINLTSLQLDGTGFYKTLIVDFSGQDKVDSPATTYDGSFSLLNQNAGDNLVKSGQSKLMRTILVLTNPANNQIASSLKLLGNYTIGAAQSDGTIANGLAGGIEIPINSLKTKAGYIYTLTLDFVNGAFTLSLGSEEMWNNGGDSTSTII